MRKCIQCGNVSVREVTEDNLVVFYCSNCGNKSGQSMQLDGKIVVKKTDNGIKHVTVGALIERDGKILLAKRRTFPYRFSNIAGHLEYDELPKAAIKREVFEEIGLQVTRAELVWHGDIVGNRCRAGADTHEWYYYKVECQGQPIINAEFEFANWYKLEELNNLDLGFATQFLFKKIGILPGDEKNES